MNPVRHVIRTSQACKPWQKLHIWCTVLQEFGDFWSHPPQSSKYDQYKQALSRCFWYACKVHKSIGINDTSDLKHTSWDSVIKTLQPPNHLSAVAQMLGLVSHLYHPMNRFCHQSHLYAELCYFQEHQLPSHQQQMKSWNWNFPIQNPPIHEQLQLLQVYH